nr:helix-turn-helix domain-containing protein [Marinifilum caeruleilacunae]
MHRVGVLLFFFDALIDFDNQFTHYGYENISSERLNFIAKYDFMYPIELRLNIFSLLILLGICQGFFLTFFFFSKENRKILANKLYGFFIAALSLMILEHWLNYTGYLPKVIEIDNFSEPLNFFIAPMAFIYVKVCIRSEFNRRDLWHLAFFAFYLIYSFGYFLQTNEFKFNSFLWVNHPELPRIEAEEIFKSDILGLRSIVNDLTLLSFLVYTGLSLRLVIKEIKKRNLQFWKLKDAQLSWLRNLVLHFSAIIVIFIFAKSFFGRDLGDHLIGAYTAIIMYHISIQVFRESQFFRKSASSEIAGKYSKSSLSEEQKDEILQKLKQVMNEEEYFASNMASLPELSKKVSSVPHHVSQVINERLHKSFFEWLAEQRIEKSKSILSNPETAKITIEELAEVVGYNSKSSFNKAFKKQTGLTPSQFRNNT